MRQKDSALDRRDFIKRGAQATAAAAAAVVSTSAAHGAVPDNKKITLTDARFDRQLPRGSDLILEHLSGDDTLFHLIELDR